jgi:hypothetical protein
MIVRRRIDDDDYDYDDNDDANDDFSTFRKRARKRAMKADDAFFENSLEEKWRKMCPQNKEKNSLTKTLNLTLWLTF